MDVLRRLFGGSKAAAPPTSEVDPAAVEAEERARDLELLKEDQARFDDLAQRQMRYAEYAWEPPAQGGERRADDAEADADRGDGG
jgi:hypothetical protein